MNSIRIDVNSFVAGVDWVTATCLNSLPASQVEAFTRGGWGYLRSRFPTEEAKPWSFMGYHGWKLGGLCWGNNRERTLVRAYGEAANMSWRACAKNATKVSRLDLAVTFFPTDRGADLAELCAEVVLLNRDNGDLRKDKKLTLVNGFGGGDTLYIGSRKSQVFARLYDKGAQSGVEAYRGAWRAEIELKDEKATETARFLVKSKNPEGDIAAFVASFFHSHGVMLRVGYEYSLPLPSTYTERDVKIEGMLRWLRSTVRPAVVRAIKEVGEGEVAAILGLGGYGQDG